jgi:chromosome segregation ATPase
MESVRDVKTVDDLENLVGKLDLEVEGICLADRPSVQEIQRLLNSLTRLRLLLNELERVQVRRYGASKVMAERFVALEARIRRMRDDLRWVGKAKKQKAPDLPPSMC